MKKIGPDQVISLMSAGNPIALWVMPGELIEFETHDWFASGRDYAQELAEAKDGIDINPATGPLGIRGASRGDILKVDILDIQLMDKGLMFSFPGSGILGDEMRRVQTQVLGIQEGIVHFNENISFPAKPMIGVMGTSPDEPVPSYLSGRHGGNMDNQHMGVGSSVYLPVFTEGGGLALGDLHGVMADGEVSEWGLETSGKVRIRTHLIKKRPLLWPFLETATDYYIVVSLNSVEASIKEAVTYAVTLLGESIGLSLEEAVSLVSLTGHVEICQVVNPTKTIRLRFSKSVVGFNLLEYISSTD